MELTTNIYTLEDLESTDLTPYDGVYLGDPWSTDYPANLNLNLTDLEQALKILKARGLRAYISTFSVPREEDMPGVEKLLERIHDKSLPVDMLEVHNAGVLEMINSSPLNIPIHMGAVANIYTSAAAKLFREHGVTRVTGSYELTLEELKVLKDLGLEVEILVQGPMALGVSEKCPAGWWMKGEISQARICNEVVHLESEHMALRARGRATWSGKDVCLLEILSRLWALKFGFFRIDGTLYGSDYIREAGSIYREAWNGIANGTPVDVKRQKEMVNKLAWYNSNGLCNGYLLGQSGSDYMGDLWPPRD